jgi:Origin recognition complex (ORC) subunit 3 N-terminus
MGLRPQVHRELPVTLVLGLATAPETLQQMLSPTATDLLSIQAFKLVTVRCTAQLACSCVSAICDRDL